MAGAPLKKKRGAIPLFLIGSYQAIAHAWFCSEQFRTGGVIFDFFTQMAHVDANVVASRFVVLLSPHLLQQLSVSHDASGVRGKHF